jgi:hypothetical protein
MAAAVAGAVRSTSECLGRHTLGAAVALLRRMTEIGSHTLATIRGGNRFTEGCYYAQVRARARGTSTLGQLFECAGGGLHAAMDRHALGGSESDR